jgi:hypothetical protein
MPKDEFPNYLFIAGIFLLFSFLLIKMPFIYSYTFDANYVNVTVDTTVNISNSPPQILSLIIDEVVAGENVTLLAGRTRTVYCNFTVRDWDGTADINRSNATLWHSSSLINNSNDNNDHYFNSSCVQVGTSGLYDSLYQCAFDVQYYANNGTWYCNATVADHYYFSQPNENYTDTGQNTTIFNNLYALNISTKLIDYGEVAVEDYSAEQIINVTNFGNRDINVSVRGYGVNESDGLAMNCSAQGNITISNERYAITSGVAFGSMNQLSGTNTNIDVLQVSQRINDTQANWNSTYWKLYVDPTNVPAGICNGTVVFTATIP